MARAGLCRPHSGSLIESIRPMTGWRNPKDPLALPKPYRLRERARNLQHKADALLKEADALLAEAAHLESEESTTSEESDGQISN
jgi:hypothetical protein